MRLTAFILLAALCLSAGAATLKHAEILTAKSDGSFLITGEQEAVLEGVVFPDPERAAKWIHRFANREVGYRELGEDRYGRKRLIVEVTPDEAMQQAAIRDGIALAYSVEKIPEIKNWMKQEAIARGEKRGIWKEAEFLATPEEAADDIGAFRLIEGKVTRIYESREGTYLNFGGDWKSDFSVFIPKRLLKLFGDLTAMPGKQVRVRGTLYHENGPMIELSQPEQLEVIDARQ